jgi:hypothetical protein
MNRLNRRPYRTRPRHTLRLEALEGRDVPSTCVVNSLGDTGVGIATDHGDLRFCLAQSNAHQGEDLIVFSVTGTINLTKALPDISDDLIIAGPGADQLTVRRDTGGDYRILTVAAGTVQVYSLTLANGYAVGPGGPPSAGGGVYNLGTLTLGGCAVWGNVAESTNEVAARGGGIFNGGSLTLFDTRVEGNRVEAGFGGGIYNKATAAVVSSAIANNQSLNGGGVYNNGALTIDRTGVTGNSVPGSYNIGGGIYNDGMASISNSTVAGNTAGFAGGGLALQGGAGATLDSSTVANNSSYLGGGVYLKKGSLSVDHCTVSGNQSTGGGRGSGSGVYAKVAVAFMRDTIVAGNTGSGKYELYGSIDSGGSNLIGGDPKLGPLQDNGGPTLTMALLPGSPAIDSGDNANAPDWDQRGPGYPRIVNGTIDIGAFELQNTGKGPAGGGSVLVTAPRPAPAALAVPQAAPEPAPHRQPVPTPAPAAVPGAAGKLAAPLVHVSLLPAAVSNPDVDLLGLGW